MYVPLASAAVPARFSDHDPPLVVSCGLLPSVYVAVYDVALLEIVTCRTTAFVASHVPVTVGVVLLGYRRLFTADHQFLPGRLVKRG